MENKKGVTIKMAVVIPFQKPRRPTWHDALSREQLARIVSNEIEREDPWLDYFDFDEEWKLKNEIEIDLTALRCIRLIASGKVRFM